MSDYILLKTDKILFDDGCNSDHNIYVINNTRQSLLYQRAFVGLLPKFKYSFNAQIWNI